MDREMIEILVALGVSLFGMTLLIVWKTTLHLEKKRVRALAQILTDRCARVLSSVEPDISKTTRFHSGIKFTSTGFWPWQEKIDILIRVELEDRTNERDVRMTLRPCADEFVREHGNNTLEADFCF